MVSLPTYFYYCWGVTHSIMHMCSYQVAFKYSIYPWSHLGIQKSNKPTQSKKKKKKCWSQLLFRFHRKIMRHAGPRKSNIQWTIPWDIPWFIITSFCLKFPAVPESLAAPFCLGESSGCASLEVNGMGRGERKRTRPEDAEGKMSIQCFLTKVKEDLCSLHIGPQ